jgi:hypothetical protein
MPYRPCVLIATVARIYIFCTIGPAAFRTQTPHVPRRLITYLWYVKYAYANSFVVQDSKPAVESESITLTNGMIKRNDSMRNPAVMSSVESGKRRECNIGFTADVFSQPQCISPISRCVKFAEAFHFFCGTKMGSQ